MYFWSVTPSYDLRIKLDLLLLLARFSFLEPIEAWNNLLLYDTLSRNH